MVLKYVLYLFYHRQSLLSSHSHKLVPESPLQDNALSVDQGLGAIKNDRFAELLTRYKLDPIHQDLRRTYKDKQE